MKNGYFQYLWLLIWNNLIKNSLIYKALCSVYKFFSSKWQKSKLASWFRRVDADVEGKSFSGKVLGIDFKILSKLGEKNEFFTKCKERSFLISACKYLLHNFLALNLRFIGIVLGVWLGLYTILNFCTGGGFNFIAALVAVLLGGISVFNINITDYIKPTITSKIAEYFLGTELSYKFYYMTKCSKSKARYYCAVIFGVLMAVLSAFVHPLMGALFLLGILFVSMVFYKVEFGVFVTVFLAPFIPTMVLAGLGVLCGCSLVVKAITSKSFKWKFGIVGMFIMLMILVYLLAALMSFARGKSLQIWFIYAVMMVFFFVAINTVKTKKQFFDLCKSQSLFSIKCLAFNL